MIDSSDIAKRQAAEVVVKLVKDGMKLGLGTGSTMDFVIRILGHRIATEGLNVSCIPTSERTAAQAQQLGIPLSDFSSIDMLDMTIDGADEVQEGTLHLIKGLGGALLREKIVAINSQRFVVVADSSKLVQILGRSVPVPVEVVAFGHEATAHQLTKMGAGPVLRLTPESKLFRTDSGNFIYDCYDLEPIIDPVKVDGQLSSIAGVVVTGLFSGIATEAYISNGQSVKRLTRTI
jgi:ribose 5-phosphate isomerase A